MDVCIVSLSNSIFPKLLDESNTSLIARLKRKSLIQHLGTFQVLAIKAHNARLGGNVSVNILMCLLTKVRRLVKKGG